MLLGGGSHTNTEISDDARDIPAAITDTGCERDLNEDRYAVIESASGVAWIVCDGMGGVTGGELAAQLAIDHIRTDLETLSARDGAVAIKSAILEANRVIVLRRQNPAFSGMGTTIVSAMFGEGTVAIAHAGDSRAYLIRDSAIQQLTVDDTYVQDLVDSGKIKPEEALSHPQAHVLTRCIGSEPSLEVSVEKYWIWKAPANEASDCLLLCTDGLYSLISESEIASIVSAHSPRRACSELVELAKSRGGYDNITLAILPIPGHLRNQAPPGFVERRGVRQRHAPPAVPVRVSLIRLALTVAICILAVLLTVLFMILRLK